MNILFVCFFFYLLFSKKRKKKSLKLEKEIVLCVAVSLYVFALFWMHFLRLINLKIETMCFFFFVFLLRRLFYIKMDDDTDTEKDDTKRFVFILFSISEIQSFSYAYVFSDLYAQNDLFWKIFTKTTGYLVI